MTLASSVVSLCSVLCVCACVCREGGWEGQGGRGEAGGVGSGGRQPCVDRCVRVCMCVMPASSGAQAATFETNFAFEGLGIDEFTVCTCLQECVYTCNNQHAGVALNAALVPTGPVVVKSVCVNYTNQAAQQAWRWSDPDDPETCGDNCAKCLRGKAAGRGNGTHLRKASPVIRSAARCAVREAFMDRGTLRSGGRPPFLPGSAQSERSCCVRSSSLSVLHTLSMMIH